jgi:Protein of unknown function (DUF1501)
MNEPTPLGRREFLRRAGGGFGALALADVIARADTPAFLTHPPRVRRVIQLFMNGGVSPMDTFDRKPELDRLHGQKLGPKERPEGQTGDCGALMKSPFPFAQHGQCGRWVSSMFPHVARHVDDLAFLMAMQSRTSVHGPGSYMQNTGFLLPGFPCLGAWVSYALGNIADNLPTFIAMPDPRGLPYNQRGNFSAGFLPATHEGTVYEPGKGIHDLFPRARFAFAKGEAEQESLALLAKLNRTHAAQNPGDSRLDARIMASELAAKMQLSAPEAFDVMRESAVMRAAYGMERKETEDFGRRCLLARRLVERGVRFVQVWSGPQGATNNWDNHGSIPKELPPMALSVDQPISALLADLKQRGLMEDTLVIWTTEFGRTPFAQGGDGRDHNGGSFVTWLAGAGVKGGVTFGQSDDWGWKAAEGKTMCYDLHATVLHLLGIEHDKLTWRHNGIDRRLTDVHGKVVREILA